MTGEDITSINNIIKAKKLSQLDLIREIADVDGANVVVIVPELDENGNIVKNENGNIKYTNHRITIAEFFRHGISSIWKTTIEDGSELDNDTLIPVITRNTDITGASDPPINTRDKNGSIVSNINKSKGATLGIIADKIVEIKNLLSESEINSKIDGAIEENITPEIENINQNIQSINQQNNNKFNDISQQITDVTGSINTIENMLSEHEQNIMNNNTNIQNIINDNKWLIVNNE